MMSRPTSNATVVAILRLDGGSEGMKIGVPRYGATSQARSPAAVFPRQGFFASQSAAIEINGPKGLSLLSGRLGWRRCAPWTPIGGGPRQADGHALRVGRRRESARTPTPRDETRPCAHGRSLIVCVRRAASRRNPRRLVNRASTHRNTTLVIGGGRLPTGHPHFSFGRRRRFGFLRDAGTDSRGG